MNIHSGKLMLGWSQDYPSVGKKLYIIFLKFMTCPSLRKIDQPKKKKF